VTTSIQDVSLSVKKDEDGTFFVNGGYSAEGYAMGVSFNTKKVSKVIARKIVALVNEIYGLGIRI